MGWGRPHAPPPQDPSPLQPQVKQGSAPLRPSAKGTVSWAPWSSHRSPVLGRFAPLLLPVTLLEPQRRPLCEAASWSAEAQPRGRGEAAGERVLRTRGWLGRVAPSPTTYVRTSMHLSAKKEAQACGQCPRPACTGVTLNC